MVGEVGGGGGAKKAKNSHSGLAQALSNGRGNAFSSRHPQSLKMPYLTLHIKKTIVLEKKKQLSSYL